MPNTVVLFHSNCLDGHTAAWAVWRRLGESATYHPVQYNQPVPPEAMAGGKDVVLVDFSYPRHDLRMMATVNRSVTVLDHHKSAEEELSNLEHPGLHVVFDMKKCGARLAWDYFQSGPPPWLVKYTESMDLWKWDQPQAREVCAYLASVPWTFEGWDHLSRVDVGTTEFRRFVTEGGAILRYQDQQIRSHVARATEVTIDGHKVWAVNATTLHSEIAGKLADRGNFGISWFRREDGNFVHSLRSSNGFDVSAVARKYGGGGHVAAAGFEALTVCPPSP